jgi:hypothetical protein
MNRGLRPATAADVRHVATNLRPADKAEALAAAGVPAIVALAESVHHSRATWSLYAEDTVAGLLGLQDTAVPEIGVVWMLCTPVIDRYPFTFLRDARELLPIVHRYHPIVTNQVDERNTVHIRWLRWMGFTFLRRIERWGAESRPFFEFARLQPPCAWVS